MDSRPAARNAMLRQAANDQRKRAIRLQVPDNAPLTPHNRKTLRTASQHRANADRFLAHAANLFLTDRNGARRARLEAIKEMGRVRELEAEVALDRQERTDAAWRERTRSETIQLERARGEIVEVADGKPSAPGRPARPRGQVRISTRDGLESLRSLAIDPTRGIFPLTSRQYAAGLRYRAAYELADADRVLGSQLGKMQGGGGPAPSMDPGAAETRRLNAKHALVRLEAMIVVEGGPSGKEWVNAVRAVAGEGRSLHSVYGGGRKHGRARVALELGLDAVADLLGI